MQTLFIIELAVLGLAIGSFLNVVIARLPIGQSVVRPRSRCPHCGHQLAWFENIPVLSYVALRGRCRACGKHISVRYVMVELLTATLFLGAQARFGWTSELVLALTFITLVVPLIFIDAQHWVLPFELTLPGIGLGLLLQLPRGWPAGRDAVIGVLAGFLVFRLLEYLGWFFTRAEAVGGGDKFFLAMSAAFMGWQALPGVILLASVQGALFGLGRIALTGRAAAELRSPSSGSASAPTQAGADSAQPEMVTPDGEPPVSMAKPAEATFTPDFVKPGIPLLRRLVLVPWSLLLQPIPDEPVSAAPPEADEGREPEWVPDPTALPFGPWIGLGALELMLLGPFLASLLGEGALGSIMRLVFPM